MTYMSNKAKQLERAVHPRWCLGADDASHIRPTEAEKNKEERYMGNVVTEKELTLIPELISEVKKLSDSNKQRLLWIAQGILIAEKNGAKS